MSKIVVNVVEPGTLQTFKKHRITLAFVPQILRVTISPWVLFGWTKLLENSSLDTLFGRGRIIRTLHLTDIDWRGNFLFPFLVGILCVLFFLISLDVYFIVQHLIVYQIIVFLWSFSAILKSSDLLWASCLIWVPHPAWIFLWYHRENVIHLFCLIVRPISGLLGSFYFEKSISAWF